MKDGFGYETPIEGNTNDWITPKYIIDAFGKDYFDLDPCASLTQPWKCAINQCTLEDDGLSKNWCGNVWLNPPYGKETNKWVQKLIKHGKGIALIYARLETKLWQHYIFPTADGFLFIEGRINFCMPNGETSINNAGAPSALIAWGMYNRNKLIDLVNNHIIRGAFLEGAYTV
jgi:hypothetical protein